MAWQGHSWLKKNGSGSSKPIDDDDHSEPVDVFGKSGKTKTSLHATEERKATILQKLLSKRMEIGFSSCPVLYSRQLVRLSNIPLIMGSSPKWTVPPASSRTNYPAIGSQ